MLTKREERGGVLVAGRHQDALAFALRLVHQGGPEDIGQSLQHPNSEKSVSDERGHLATGFTVYGFRAPAPLAVPARRRQLAAPERIPGQLKHRFAAKIDQQAAALPDRTRFSAVSGAKIGRRIIMIEVCFLADEHNKCRNALAVRVKEPYMWLSTFLPDDQA